MSAIPLLLPDLPDASAILPFLKQIDAARWYTNFGPLSRQLEASLASTFGDEPPYVASVSNCTLGLELALSSLGLTPGGRVLVPALTFVASATAILRAGFQPILADVDPTNWMLTPDIARNSLARNNFEC